MTGSLVPDPRPRPDTGRDVWLVRVSWWRVAVFSILYAMPALGALGLAANLARGQPVTGAHLLMFLVLAGAAVGLYKLMFAHIRTGGVIMELRPEGLVLPVLGSRQPIPWERVRIRGGPLLSWPIATMILARIDPRVHDRLPLFGRGLPRRRRMAEQTVSVVMPNIMQGGRARLIRIADEYRAAAGVPRGAGP